ncbi:hypothetical protein [Neisseria sicca]|uniref:hypothetical protein n=1 Tax=Neisseria sicca TaxID=490 RepID=UPI0021C0AC71|nr:hypothetical protein [Neisseria sicca]
MAVSVKEGFSDDVDYSRSSENGRMAKGTIKDRIHHNRHSRAGGNPIVNFS